MNPLNEIQEPPVNQEEYQRAADVMTAVDEYGLAYLKYVRAQQAG